MHLHHRTGHGGLSRQLQPGDHNHTFDVPVLVGPMVLRVVLLAAVCAVTCFAMLRAFLGEPGRTTSAVITTCAAVAIVFELMLATGFDLPDQVAVLILGGIAVPFVLSLSRSPGALTATRYVERYAPWVVAVTATAAFVEFTRALLGAGDRAILLHTGLMLALVGLSWYTFALPRWRPGSVATQILAATLASATIAGAGFTTALMAGA